MLYTAKVISVSWLLVLPCQQGGWGARGAGKKQNQDSGTKLAKGMFLTIWCRVEL